jgi:RNA polymerase sigma factor (sigma-70 family)
LATVLVGPHAAHDLVADTVLRCVAREGWPDVANPAGYLTRALVHAASTAERSEAARRRRELRVALWSRADAPATDQRSGVDALAVLSPTQAAIVFLLYWEDVTIAEAARRLGVSQGTVRKQLDRAKRRLRKVLSDDDHR